MRTIVRPLAHTGQLKPKGQKRKIQEKLIGKKTKGIGLLEEIKSTMQSRINPKLSSVTIAKRVTSFENNLI